MNNNNEESSDTHGLRSINSMNKSPVYFVNKTSRDIDIIWIDYNGDEVQYNTLPPNKCYQMSTFLTHPWIFRDHKRRDKLLSFYKNIESINNNNKSRVIFDNVFISMSTEPQIVFISNGLYTLKERCLQALFDTIPDTKDWHLLEIPKSLVNDYHNYLNRCKANANQ